MNGNHIRIHDYPPAEAQGHTDQGIDVHRQTDKECSLILTAIGPKYNVDAICPI